MDSIIDWKISLGTILQGLAIISILVKGWLVINTRLAIIEADIKMFIMLDGHGRSIPTRVALLEDKLESHLDRHDH